MCLINFLFLANQKQLSGLSSREEDSDGDDVVLHLFPEKISLHQLAEGHDGVDNNYNNYNNVKCLLRNMQMPRILRVYMITINIFHQQY